MKRYIFIFIAILFTACFDEKPTHKPTEQELKFAFNNIELVAAKATVGFTKMPYCELKHFKKKIYVMCVPTEFKNKMDKSRRRVLFFIKKIKTVEKLNYGTDEKSELSYFPLIIPMSDESIFFINQSQNLNTFLDDNNGMLYNRFKSKVPKGYSSYEPTLSETLEYAKKSVIMNPEYIVKKWYK